MFHTYVRGVHGQKIDFDRASWLMARDLLDEALALRKDEKPTPGDADTTAQRVWNTYCALHQERYGHGFQPDLDPLWDKPSNLSSRERLAIVLKTLSGEAEPEPAGCYAPIDIRAIRR